MRVAKLVLILSVLLLMLPGCALRRSTEPPPPPSAMLKVPQTELPRPGECRVWMPGAQADEQRPAGPCERLSADVPSGAWLMHRPVEQSGRVKVAVYHPARPGLLMAIHVYDAGTGNYLGNEHP